MSPLRYDSNDKVRFELTTLVGIGTDSIGS